ncbi:MAG: glycosyltransferase N-terminal domain-containing protein [Hyphomicrobiaceae bacterium]|nr:glycosyltransferase N-terminal domain-containing protein [Hyphomicrobiaceae bacterium]
MASPRLTRGYLSRLGGSSLAGLIRLVARTSRTLTDPPALSDHLSANSPAILACWHGQFMMLATARPPTLRFAAMVARHGDAEPIARAMEALGVELIRGAGAGSRRKDRGGAHALRAALRTLESGASIVMTADVPPGPARRAGAGIVMLAKLSGRPILPVASATSRYYALDTWSRMTINLPFSRLGHVAGEPIHVPGDATPDELEAKRLEVEAAVTAAMQRAYALAGADPARATPSSVRTPTALSPSALRSPAQDITQEAAAPPPPGFRLKTYRTATRLLQPVAPLILRWRAGSGKEDPSRRSERVGRADIARPSGRLAWLHAASVGEMNAVLPLIGALSKARPDIACLLTTGTVTSAELASQRLAGTVVHQYVPLDVPAYVARFLDHWQPDLAVLTESEIWPNIIMETSRRGIPLALVNARMSNRSFDRWRGQGRAAEALFGRFDVVLAQNETIAGWIAALGARRVEAVGNLKIDAPPLPVDVSAYQALSAAASGRRGYVAASTHDGEEAIIGQAHKILARTFDGFLTIIAPRHPERGTGIAEDLRRQGLKIVQRSTGRLPDATTEIYIADTIGELGTLYALAPIALIGGSLVDRGGQNPIEAIRHHAAVLSGPSGHNFADAYAALARHGGVTIVHDADELAAAIAALLTDESTLARTRAAADAALASMTGSLERTVAVLSDLVPDGEVLKRAS